jgi:hypothetical protein
MQVIPEQLRLQPLIHVPTLNGVIPRCTHAQELTLWSLIFVVPLSYDQGVVSSTTRC